MLKFCEVAKKGQSQLTTIVPPPRLRVVSHLVVGLVSCKSNSELAIYRYRNRNMHHAAHDHAAKGVHATTSVVIRARLREAVSDRT